MDSPATTSEDVPGHPDASSAPVVSGRSSMELSDISMPPMMSTGAPPGGEGEALDLAALTARLEAQLATILRDALREHAKTTEQQLQLLRWDLAPFVRGRASRPPTAKRKVPQHFKCCSDSVLLRPQLLARALDEAGGGAPDAEGGDGHEPRLINEDDSAMLTHQKGLVLCQEPARAPGDPHHREARPPKSKPVSLEALEESLAHELFEAQELHVPASCRAKLPRVPPQRWSWPLALASSPPAFQMHGRAAVLPSEFSWDDGVQSRPSSNMSSGFMESSMSGGIMASAAEELRRSSSDTAPDSPVDAVAPWRQSTVSSYDRMSFKRKSTRHLTKDSSRTQGSADSNLSSKQEPTPSLSANCGSVTGTDTPDLAVSSRRGLACNTRAMRQNLEKELINIYRRRTSTPLNRTSSSISSSEYRIPFWIPFVLLRACGTLPWTVSSATSKRTCASAMYQWAAVLLPVLAIASYVREASVEANMHVSMSSLSDVSLALGSLLGLMSLGVVQYRTIYGDCNALLLSYSHSEGILEEWMHRSYREIAVALVNWICAVALRIAIAYYHVVEQEGHFSAQIVRSTAFFALNSMQLMALAFSITHICCGLACMIDSFCCALAELQDLGSATSRWNVLQAVLRKACWAVEKCLFVLQATLTSMFLLSIADLIISGSCPWRLLALLPAAVVMLGITRILFSAAAVTAKCARVPPFVNSLTFGRNFDRERQYVVDYITHSHAGFYVFEVRLTSSMALKFLYVSGACAFTLAARAVSEMQ